MTYTAVVPMSGHAGWAFLERTREQQQAAMANDPALTRLTSYFSENIGKITSAEELIADRKLREVALGAFGLQDDMENLAFLVKVLESDTTDSTSFADKLADSRYTNIAKAFGFGDPTGARTGEAGFAEQIIQAFEDQQFEVSVGETDTNLRLALSLERELAAINEQTDLSDDARWYKVMATPALREIFEVALGLPDSFGSLDIDVQLREFRSRAEQRLGASEISAFSDPELLETLRSRFLSGAEAQALIENNLGSNQIALTLLSSIAPLS